jgi:hypothetical protein
VHDEDRLAKPELLSAWNRSEKRMVVQILNDESQGRQVQLIYSRAAAVMGPAIEYEVLVNRKKPVHAV